MLFDKDEEESVFNFDYNVNIVWCFFNIESRMKEGKAKYFN